MLIQKLSDACGAAGDEEEIRGAIREQIVDFVDEISVNSLGNLIARKAGADVHRSILVTAHMDEVAFIVTSVEKSGLIKFHTVGGMVEKILPGNAVAVGKKRIPGIIASRSYHLLSEEERKRVPDVKDLAIDIGAGSKEEVKEVSAGDYAYFRSGFFTQNGCCYGKAFDDRVGCSALCELLRDPGLKKPPVCVVATFTVQEEVGLRGAATAAFGLEGLSFNLNLEGTTCSDRELKKSYSPVTELGKGPAITFMDRTTITDKRLLEFTVSVAEKHRIPFQLKKGTSGGTDAGVIHLTEAGLPSISVSVPVRYIHSPWNIMSIEDYSGYVALARALVAEAAGFSP